MSLPRIVSSDPLEDRDAKWIGLRRLVYRDRQNNERLWECADRKTRRGDCDAACIVPILRAGQTADGQPVGRRIILVKQFRPPLGRMCIECPAGLIDAGETAEDTAIRELKEETGFVGRIQRISPVTYADPGFSSACLRYIYMDIDPQDPRNVKPEAKLEEGEDIEVIVLPLRGLARQLEVATQEGAAVDARLQAFADAIALFGDEE